MTTVLPTKWVLGACKFGLHDACYGGYAATQSMDGEPVAEMRCPCDCGHTAQALHAFQEGDE